MATKKKVIQGEAAGVNPLHRYRWFEYVEEDAEEGEIPFRVRMRTNLPHIEIENLRERMQGATSDPELWPVFAPYVTDWNIEGERDGATVEIPAPATGGADQFGYVPPQLFGAIVRDLLYRSTPPLARRTPGASGPTPAPSPDDA